MILEDYVVRKTCIAELFLQAGMGIIGAGKYHKVLCGNVTNPDRLLT